jgi:hypothetical protein
MRLEIIVIIVVLILQIICFSLLLQTSQFNQSLNTYDNVQFKALNIGGEYTLPLTSGDTGFVLTALDNGLTTWELPNFARNEIIWKPGSITSGNTVSTWDEIVNVLNDNSNLVTIFVDDSISETIITQSVNCQHLVQFLSVNNSTLKFQAGTWLENPGCFGGSLQLELNVGSIQLSDQSNISFKNQVQINSNGFIEVLDNTTVTINIMEQVYIQPTSLFVNLNVNSILNLFITNYSSSVPSNFISSVDNTSTLVYTYDSTGPVLQNSGFLGTFNTINTSKSLHVVYNDTNTTLVQMGTNVQNALDFIKEKIVYLSAYFEDATNNSVFSDSVGPGSPWFLLSNLPSSNFNIKSNLGLTVIDKVIFTNTSSVAQNLNMNLSMTVFSTVATTLTFALYSFIDDTISEDSIDVQVTANFLTNVSFPSIVRLEPNVGVLIAMKSVDPSVVSLRSSIISLVGIL